MKKNKSVVVPASSPAPRTITPVVRLMHVSLLSISLALSACGGGGGGGGMNETTASSGSGSVTPDVATVSTGTGASTAGAAAGVTSPVPATTQTPTSIGTSTASGSTSVATSADVHDGGAATATPRASTGSRASPPGQSQATTAATGVPSIAAPRRIAFYGDSTMRGSRAGNVSALAPVTSPQAMIDALPAGAFIAMNEGVNSSHTDELIAGGDGVHGRWEAELARSNADIIVINHGSQFQPSISTYKENLHTMTEQARAAGKLVIFQTPSPTQNGRGGMDPIVAAMKQQAEADKVPVIDVYEYLYRHMAATGQSERDLVPDGYHPSDSTYVLIGTYAAEVFRTIVK